MAKKDNWRTKIDQWSFWRKSSVANIEEALDDLNWKIQKQRDKLDELKQDEKNLRLEALDVEDEEDDEDIARRIEKIRFEQNTIRARIDGYYEREKTYYQVKAFAEMREEAKENGFEREFLKYGPQIVSIIRKESQQTLNKEKLWKNINKEIGVFHHFSTKSRKTTDSIVEELRQMRAEAKSKKLKDTVDPEPAKNKEKTRAHYDER